MTTGKGILGVFQERELASITPTEDIMKWH